MRTRFVRSFRLTFCSLAVCSAVLLSTAIRAQETRSYYPAAETHMIPSKYVRQTFKVQVMRPSQTKGETTRFPVVYTGDGNLVFDLFKGISYLLQFPGGDAQRFILVAIGYPSDSPAAGWMLRSRDFTFPGYPNLAGRPPPPIEGVAMAEKGAKNFYGAEDFQRFIAEELVPFIDRKYPTAPGDRTYFGHSAGGGFGLFTLFTKTELFKNYIISSPGVIYNGRTPGGTQYDNYEFVLDDARKFIASGKSLSGVRVYMSVGTEEEFEPYLAQWQLTSSFYRMAKLLKTSVIPGLELTSEVFPGERHMTVWPLAFMHGVQAVLQAEKKTTN